MKQYVTVYELIRKLAEYPADKYVEFRVWVNKEEQLNVYEQEFKNDDYIGFDASEIDMKFDVNLSKSEKTLIIEMDADDVERKEE